jgi:hypothetical protein
MSAPVALALAALIAAQDPCLGASATCRRAAAQAVRDLEVALAVTESSQRQCLDRLSARTPTVSASLAAVAPDRRASTVERDAALALAGVVAGVLAGAIAVSLSR